MSDKVQKIRQEIERRYNCEKCYPLDREANVAAAVLQELLLFIDSLPEEPASKDLEEYAKKLAKGAALDKHNLIWMCKKGAEWQKQKDLQDFLEKAERYLNYTLYSRVEIEVYGTLIPSITNKKEFINDFKNYMKDEI